MSQEKAPRAVDELVDEVREIRDLVERIEKRSQYLRPDGVLMSAGKQITSGILRGIGVLIGGILFFLLFGFIVHRVLSSDRMQGFIGAQIQSAITGVIEKQVDALPFR